MVDAIWFSCGQFPREVERYTNCEALAIAVPFLGDPARLAPAMAITVAFLGNSARLAPTVAITVAFLGNSARPALAVATSAFESALKTDQFACIGGEHAGAYAVPNAQIIILSRTTSIAHRTDTQITPGGFPALPRTKLGVERIYIQFLDYLVGVEAAFLVGGTAAGLADVRDPAASRATRSEDDE